MRKWLKNQIDKLTRPALDWVQVEVTTYCNASCYYCPHQALRSHWTNRHMSLDLFKRLLPFLSQTDLVFLQGWGEPLLNPALFDMIRLSKNQGNRTGFTTNGMLLSVATARKLIDMKLDILGVSIAGTRAHTHNNIRRGTDLTKVIRNLQRLTQIKQEAGSELPEIHLAYLVLKTNFDELTEIIPLAKKAGACAVVVSNLSLLLDIDRSDEPIFMDTKNIGRYHDTLEQIQKEAKDNGIHFSYNGPGLNDASLQCGENVSRACVISVGGEVVPCVMTDPVLSQKDDAGPKDEPVYIFNGQFHPLKEMVFGRIGEETLTHIWNTQTYRSFRNLFASDPYTTHSSAALERLPQCCQKCYKRLLEKGAAHAGNGGRKEGVGAN